jgi:hypothetical protein
MRQKPTLLLGVCFVLGCLVLGLFLSPPSAGQAAPAPPPAGRPGMYQVSVAYDQGNMVIFFCDTETGQLWRSTGSTTWHEFPSPTTKKAK